MTTRLEPELAERLEGVSRIPVTGQWHTVKKHFIDTAYLYMDFDF